ncbi:hypothetical protein [Sporomusa sp. KB1]|jgi:hypothetical protein|uniref:DUF6916 family protein n=1 Tax=Sporomusa sp. KB1 TaxID=943346 RepID=UPI0011A3B370|nr:hypothetical protein [Sporomusa sp. KB1]TWH48798.1 hypothetical protein Salpa_4973 [Sporomusa sp. KB1]
MVAKLHKQDFEPHLNEQFIVHSNEIGPVEMDLVKVSGQTTGKLESFSLLFCTAEGKAFRHNTCQVTHPAMGDFPLFLGPVDTGKTDGIYYEAVFNYIINNNKEG